ncbi:MAG TPA: VWA domain-containing protein [Candidatus Dormibacteraeota bacterium]|nr:VWA domain-containing protein [Candidatus Dormibacteraeota bacterium]
MAGRNLSPGKVGRRSSSLPVIVAGCVALFSPRIPASGQNTQPLQNESSAVGLETTIRQSVRRVLVDVVVTDHYGKPVEGLRQEDFRVFENGALQQIRTFSVPPSVPSTSSSEVDSSRLPPATFTNASTVSDDAPLNIILWDLRIWQAQIPEFNNTQAQSAPITSMLSARKQVIDFLRHKPPATRFAIFLQTDRLKLLQGFTDDATQLAASMEKDETRAIGYWPAFRPSPPHFAISRNNETIQARVGLFSRLVSGFDPLVRKKRSLDDLENLWAKQAEIDGLWELARWTVALPGRKNVYWITSSFPGPPELMEQGAAILALSRVAVFPIDWRTLSPDLIYDVTTNADAQTKVLLRTDPRAWLPQLSQQYLQDDRERIENVVTIAEQTGGHAFFYTNDLRNALSVAAEEGSRVYTLTYSPSNTKFYGQRRKIKVELVGNRGCHLSYRRSYFADPVSKEPTKDSSRHADPLGYASQFGAPTSQEILFTAQLEKEKEPRVANQVEKDRLAAYARAEKTSGHPHVESTAAVLVRDYVIHYSILPRSVGVAASNKDGKQIEIATTAYDAEGRIVYGVHGSLSPLVALDQGEGADDAYRGNQAVALPAAAAFLRFAILEKASGRIGSLQVSVPR